MISFRAHRGETDQTGFIAKNYSPVLFTSTSPDKLYVADGYDNGNRFSLIASTWTPVIAGEPSALIQFSGQLWILDPAAFLGSGDYYVARITKNGPPSIGTSVGKAAIGTKGSFTSAICGSEDWVIDLTMQAIANPGDSFALYLFTPTTTTTLNGNCLHTAWAGHIVGLM